MATNWEAIFFFKSDQGYNIFFLYMNVTFGFMLIWQIDNTKFHPSLLGAVRPFLSIGGHSGGSPLLPDDQNIYHAKNVDHPNSKTLLSLHI